MIALLCFVLAVLVSPFKQRADLKPKMLRSDTKWLCCNGWCIGASGLPTAIACSLSSCIDGFGPAFVGTGGGSRARLEGGRRLPRSCGR